MIKKKVKWTHMKTIIFPIPYHEILLAGLKAVILKRCSLYWAMWSQQVWFCIRPLRSAWSNTGPQFGQPAAPSARARNQRTGTKERVLLVNIVE